MNLGRYWL